MTHIQTILHPTDFSAGSCYAFTVACKLAKAVGAKILVVHVCSTDATLLRGFCWGDLVKLQESEAEVTVEYVLLETGHPASEILRLARETPDVMIVMGTHGRTGIVRLLMGSVAEHVVHHAPCPVLTVKIPHPDAATISEPALPTLVRTSDSVVD